MAYIDQVSIDDSDDADAAVGRLYRSSLKRAGVVANIIRVMSQHGPTAEASVGFYVAAMKSENALSAAQREMLAAVVSNANDCFY